MSPPLKKNQYLGQSGPDTFRTIRFSIIIIVLLCLLVFLYRFTANGYVVSSFNGKEYLVQNGFRDKQQAADLLAKMCAKLDRLITILIKQYPNDASLYRLNNNLKCQRIIEGDGKNGITSYTEGKGSEMVICLRDHNGKLHDENLLTFVMLHEMAHVMSKTYGHNEEFKKNFLFLLEEAEARNFYRKVNYNIDHQNYCGILVNSTPE